MPREIEPAPLGAHKKNIVIIGGGATGALTAFELQRAGHQVTLLEAGGWGNGSSSRSAACIRAQFGTPSTVKGMVYATQFYEAWQDIVGGPMPVITQNGYLFLLDHNVDMEAVRKQVAMQREAGLDGVELLDRAELDSRFPYLETTGVIAATWCPSDGFLDPGSVYGDAVAAAVRLGAVAKQNAKVVDAVFSDGMPIAVMTDSGDHYPGDVFVNAAGVWAPGISHLLQGYLLDIRARRRYLYFLHGFNGHGGQYLTTDDFRHLPMVITPRGCYCRPEGAQGGGLMMGWAHPVKPERPEFGNQDDVEKGFGADELTGYGMAIRKEIATYLPDTESMGQMARASAGFYEDTPDHNPFIGYDPWVPNLIHAAGFSGHGLMHAPYTARTVAELVANGQDMAKVRLPLGLGEVDITTFAVDRVFRHAEGMVI